jgi:hypothetical protein
MPKSKNQRTKFVHVGKAKIDHVGEVKIGEAKIDQVGKAKNRSLAVLRQWGAFFFLSPTPSLGPLRAMRAGDRQLVFGGGAVSSQLGEGEGGRRAPHSPAQSQRRRGGKEEYEEGEEEDQQQEDQQQDQERRTGVCIGNAREKRKMWSNEADKTINRNFD